MKYRKKPVVIEAEPFHESDAPLPFSGRGDPCCLGPTGWYIATLEGDHKLTRGDMVIRGVAGEFYPCKPDIFAKTYEAVDGPDPAEAIKLAREALGVYLSDNDSGVAYSHDTESKIRAAFLALGGSS